jgi:hypothetical protein
MSETGDKTERERFFKLTRPDGSNCSNANGRVVYEVGKITRPIGDVAKAADVCATDCCGKGRLHVCPKVEQVLTYRADGVPVLDHRILAGVVPEGEHVLGWDEKKVAVSAFLAEEELPISAGFGPNGVAVVEFLRELPFYPWLSAKARNTRKAQVLVDAHMAALGLPKVPVRFGSWDAARDAARAAAWAVAWAAARVAEWLVAADLLSGRENPFAPPMDLWRLGYYVGGVSNGVFVLGVRKL